MPVAFDTDAVEKWANFSRDYNPIHFDPDAAVEVIEKGLVAHGMLVLLPVKQALTDAIPALVQASPAAGHWARLRSSFRRPVPQARDVEIHLTPGTGKTTYTVLGRHDQTPHFQGLLSSAMPPEPWLSGDATAFDRKLLAQRWEYFQGSFPDIVASWIFIDALIFSAFIEHDASDLIAMVTDGLASSVSEAGDRRFVVQTSQCVWFDHAYLQTIVFPQALDLTYRCARGDWIIDGSRVIGTVGLEARLDDRRVLHSDVGLLLQGSI